MSPRSRLLGATCIALSWACATSSSGRSTRELDVEMTSGPGGKEILVAAPDRAFYFNNDETRLCFKFSVSGSWVASEESGLLVSRSDPNRFAGVLVRSAQELQSVEGADMVERAARATQATYEERLGSAPVTAAFEPVSSSPGAARAWVARWNLVRNGRQVRLDVRKVFTQLEPGWVAQITASDPADEREMLQTLGTTRDPGCYRAFVQAQFPTVKIPPPER